MLRSGEISVVELAEAHIRQIERLNPRAQRLRRLRCRTRARAGSAAWTHVGSDQRGPLLRPARHGQVFHRHRGLSNAKSAACSTKATFPREDAVVVARLRAAGALILGTTNCPEFLMAYETDNLLHGRT